MPVELTLEASIVPAVCTYHTIGLTLLTDLPLASELRAPDEIPVVVDLSA